MRFLSLSAVLVFAATCTAADPVEALDLVNAKRAARGLKPYERDDGLTLGAMACAQYRADRLYASHVSQYRGESKTDFSFLPPGCRADAGGCAAYPPELTFGACAMYDDYKTAGAAYVVGRDGLRYCELFVRKGPPTATIQAKEFPIMGGYGPPAATPAPDTRVDDMNARLLAAEQWGTAGGYRAPAATSPVTLANLDQRLAAMEAFGSVAGYRPPARDRTANAANLEKRLHAVETFGGTLGYVPPTSKPAAAVPSAKTVHCIQYTDMTKTKIAREWDEPAPAWLSSGGGCPNGSCGEVAPAQIRSAIQGGCSSGQCPNQKAVPVRGGYFPG